jgi:dCMP deaminase
MISIKEQQEMMREAAREAARREERKGVSSNLTDAPVRADLERPLWDDWFMTLCFVVAQRSLDKHTKHGCVVVDDSRSILCVGYNSPPRGCVDSIIPLERPAKYDYMQHSEANAITNAARNGINLFNSTFYITGPPCPACFGKMLNVGVHKIIHGPILHQSTPAQIEAMETMKMHQDVEIIVWEGIDSVFKLLKGTESYITRKLGEQT